MYILAYVLHHNEIKRIEVIISRYARILCNVVDKKTVSQPVSDRLPDHAIWARLGIVPIDLELRIRRLQWWQSISLRPDVNSCIIALFFCSFDPLRPLFLSHDIRATRAGSRDVLNRLRSSGSRWSINCIFYSFV